MTNAIEQTKREMWGKLHIVKLATYVNQEAAVEEFETALEGYLESLRQDRAKIIEERDELRNKHQALQMASQTAAEVIRGLRSELLEARECNATASASEAPQSEFKDVYHLGFNSIGKPCPFPCGTIERLHWMDGSRDRAGLLEQINYNCFGSRRP